MNKKLTTSIFCPLNQRLSFHIDSQKEGINKNAFKNIQEKDSCFESVIRLCSCGLGRRKKSGPDTVPAAEKIFGRQKNSRCRYRLHLQFCTGIAAPFISGCRGPAASDVFSAAPHFSVRTLCRVPQACGSGKGTPPAHPSRRQAK